MKKLSETYKELGIAFSFPIKIRDANGRVTYSEDSDDCWYKYEYDANGRVTYSEDSNDFWYKYEYDANGKVTYYEDSNDLWYKYEYGANGKVTYFENSNGFKRGTPKSSKTCEGKVVEVDGIKYKLKAL
jgi:YD repeat-containing protein